MLRTAGILFPILVMVRALATFHRRRRQQVTSSLNDQPLLGFGTWLGVLILITVSSRALIPVSFTLQSSAYTIFWCITLGSRSLDTAGKPGSLYVLLRHRRWRRGGRRGHRCCVASLATTPYPGLLTPNKFKSGATSVRLTEAKITTKIPRNRGKYTDVVG